MCIRDRLYGIILCNARAMGEFGAVSVVSGHIRGLTNTMPLHIEILYNEYNFVGAFAVASLLIDVYKRQTFRRAPSPMRATPSVCSRSCAPPDCRGPRWFHRLRRSRIFIACAWVRSPALRSSTSSPRA